MNRYIIGALSLLFVACSSLQVEKLQQPTSRPAVGLVAIGYPAIAEEFKAWVELTAPEKCKELGIPLPLQVNVMISTGPITILPEYQGRIWIQGYYSSGLITIYVIDGFYNVRDLKGLKHTFYHELLHFYDELNGKSFPEDHNAIFDKRIADLHWE